MMLKDRHYRDELNMNYKQFDIYKLFLEFQLNILLNFLGDLYRF